MWWKIWCAVLICAAQSIAVLSSTTPALAQSAVSPPAAPADFSCDQNAGRPRAGGASVARTAGESLQHKNWQPVGGLVEFTVNMVTPLDAEATITTCFRWKTASG